MTNLVFLFLSTFSTKSLGIEIVDASHLHPGLEGSKIYSLEPLNLDETENGEAIGKKPGVFLLHGSTVASGRHYTTGRIAKHLAAKGYTVLEYCYFYCGPSKIKHEDALINYDVFNTYLAFQWFKKKVTNGKVAFYGLSRGAEHTLLFSEYVERDLLPEKPELYILHSPPSNAKPAFAWNWIRKKCWKCKNGKRCKFKSPLDARYKRHLIPRSESNFLWKSSCGKNPRSMNLLNASAWLWKGVPVNPVTAWSLDTESKFKNNPFGHYYNPAASSRPFLIFQGGKDRVWPAKMTRTLAMRLRDNLDFFDTTQRPVATFDVTGSEFDPTLIRHPDFSSSGKNNDDWHKVFYFLSGDHILSRYTQFLDSEVIKALRVYLQ